ncbi:MAG: hypothetical protein HY048_02020 [Acidobacteria bacterium]|nr:hypothetical protein [Acidobacteriota bacterium]
MRTRFFAVVGVALLIGLASAAWAQSLAEVAKKEEERRKAIVTPARVYTNKDLGPGREPATPPPATAPADTAKDAEKKDTKDAKDADAKDAGGKDAPKDQKYWSERLKALQAKLDHDSSFADALQVKINAQMTDFINRDDPVQKAQIERDRNKSLADLDALKKEIEKDKKALADFQEEARRAGVPPGWLR